MTNGFDDFYAIIPAGGTGTRLWPLSRERRPKFFYDLLGQGRTLIQSTYDRLAQICGMDHVCVSTGDCHVATVREQLPEIGADQIFAEPAPRDSTAAIALATAVLARRNGGDIVVGSFAADHVIRGKIAFIEAVRQAVELIGRVDLQRKYLKEYTEFLAIPSEKYNGTLPVEKRDDGDYDLEFRDVSFRYPNQEQWSLRHVTCRLPKGRKLAVVGPNGAGKTTFIKLLCRLYDPTEGAILLNGIDIRKYDYGEYLSLLSVVFQDFKLFSMKLGESVASSADYDPRRVWECLEKAGMRGRVERMEKGLDTGLFQQEEDGVELSGGEGQKLAIARALYKDAPVVVLDEPTAALDPVSEYEIYSRFGEMTAGKTSVYISHRMSSCRFCDVVFVFDGGTIVQQGSHEALLAQDGLYSRLWQAQAQYY